MELVVGEDLIVLQGLLILGLAFVRASRRHLPGSLHLKFKKTGV